MEAKLISLILLSIGLIGLTEAYFDAEFQRISSDIESKNRLKFGDACNFPQEQERQKFTKTYLEAKGKAVMGLLDAFDPNKQSTSGGAGAAATNLAQSASAASQSLRSISTLPGHFCNQSQNLACLSTGTCGCAEMDETTGFKVSYKREGEACVLTQGAVCSAQEFAAQLLTDNPFRSGGGAKEAFTCTSSAKCVVKGSGEECNSKNMEAKGNAKLKELQDKAKGPMDIAKSAQGMMEIMRSGLCVCAGTNILSSFVLIALTTAVAVSVL